MKRLFVILMALAFLLPATGMHFFVHHCTAMNHNEISLDGSSSCCGKTGPIHKATNQELPGSAFKAPECCSDEMLLVKINESYLLPNAVVLFAPALMVKTLEFNFTPDAAPIHSYNNFTLRLEPGNVWLTTLSIRI
ncbi:MAG: hypothetical protein PHX54_07360 [Lentimicrobiaceae bacterium]|nr:hypothetical protein [Lentimicrobiaceae bacterium]